MHNGVPVPGGSDEAGSPAAGTDGPAPALPTNGIRRNERKRVAPRDRSDDELRPSPGPPESAGETSPAASGGPGDAASPAGAATDEGGSDPATDLGLLSLALIWGINFSVIKVGLEELHPLAYNALRFPLAAGVLLLLLRMRPGPRPPIRREDWSRLVGLGILGNVAYQLLFIFGIDATLAGNAAILLATTPVWTTILSTALGHERPPTSAWLGVGATLAGMVLVVLGGERRVGMGGDTLIGDVMMVGSSVVWSVYTVGGRNLTRRYGSLRVTGWTLWVGTLGLVPMGVPFLLETPLDRVSPMAWGSVVYAGVFAIGLAYALWYRGVRRLGSSRTAVYSNLVPVVALVVAWAWLGERPSLLQVLGALAVIGGLTVARLARRRPGTRAEPPLE